VRYAIVRRQVSVAYDNPRVVATQINLTRCHSSKFRDSETQAGIHTAIEERQRVLFIEKIAWMPAFAGMTQVKACFWLSQR
jgi:hypothetical protein